jgi:hypothetical protein
MQWPFCLCVGSIKIISCATFYIMLYFVLFSRHTFYAHVCTSGCKVFHATGVVSLLSSLCMSIL